MNCDLLEMQKQLTFEEVLKPKENGFTKKKNFTEHLA